MKNLFLLVLCIVIMSSCLSQVSMAYDIPQRKIEIKPYLGLIFTNNFWELENGSNIIDDNASLGFGVKLRTEFRGQFGIVINTSSVNFTTLNDASRVGFLFTVGGYYSRQFGFGNLTVDLGYGAIGAADDVVGLLMPSLEISRSISDRISLALEIGLPIANDWIRDYGYRENIGTFSLSMGTVLLF